MDIHLHQRFLGIPLAPIFPAYVRQLWLPARLRATWAAGSARRRVYGVRSDARCWNVGGWTRDRILHCGRILPSHGCWCCLGAWVQTGNWAACGWALGLGVDYGVDD